MAYIGNVPTTAAFPFDQFSGTGSQTAFTLTYAPAGTTSIIVTVTGVVQNPNTYTVVGTTLTFTGAPPSGTNNIGVVYLGLPAIVGVPGVGTVGIAQLSATGTPSSGTFLRGDNTWSSVIIEQINTQTGTTYTLALTDASKMVTLANASSITVTIPPNSTIAFPIGTTIDFAQLGAGQVTFAPGSGVTLNGTPSLKCRTQYSGASLIKLGTDSWLLVGDLFV